MPDSEGANSRRYISINQEVKQSVDRKNEYPENMRLISNKTGWQSEDMRLIRKKAGRQSERTREWVSMVSTPERAIGPDSLGGCGLLPQPMYTAPGERPPDEHRPGPARRTGGIGLA